MVSLPRVLVAAPASGSGKTMITTGLIAALRDRGLGVSPHKVGPDYIDPGYHTQAAGRPGRNLDAHLVGEYLLAPLLLHGASVPTPADIAVIEGVMGLFDGALGTDGFASSAHVARATDTPVLLVVNCAAASRSVAAVVHGFATFEPGVRVGGVILNNVASPRHEAEAQAAVAATGVRVLGSIPRLPDVVVPSRHLGLIPAAERRPEALGAVEALAGMAREHIDLDGVLDLAAQAPELHTSAWDPAEAIGATEVGRTRRGAGHEPVVAVAAGAAFTFGYAETPELLRAAGARVQTFDPLRDEGLPAGTDGIVLGGGFPEVHAAALGANRGLRTEIAAFAEGGGPVFAECAGMLYLLRELDGVPMCDVLPATGAMHPRLVLGYRSAVALADSIIAPEGARVAGHEFHRTRVQVDPEAADQRAWGWRDSAGRPETEGFVHGRVHASYLHTHWAGRPGSAAAFVRAAAGDRRGAEVVA
ncbi:cobyrinic acid a,c-diamide synthase [Kineosphaera limosa]|uniref:Hydrogenobyrinate a,c-diamide synthase n=1 Tax=Kineosphaera limosa NBRC 100340 TaxID=1184609 RepID=K6WXU4_9MICO|nr:cobyrinate a,c-diamide synthase [Kineosphaera limosa]NYD99059.1 cobyrinic acid a,c-diamide synthase [Kineosphaera limosa]GAB96907.1 cobyrinic acid a,c-diamide synthase [Kineosphaera limosa NBRC 100340]